MAILTPINATLTPIYAILGFNMAMAVKDTPFPFVYMQAVDLTPTPPHCSALLTPTPTRQIILFWLITFVIFTGILAHEFTNGNASLFWGCFDANKRAF